MVLRIGGGTTVVQGKISETKGNIWKVGIWKGRSLTTSRSIRDATGAKNVGNLNIWNDIIWKCRSLETSTKSRSLMTSWSHLDNSIEKLGTLETWYSEILGDIFSKLWRSLETSNKSRSLTTSRSNLGTLESSIGFIWKCRSLETSNKSRSLTTSQSNLDTRDEDLRDNIWKQCRSLKTSNKSRSLTTSRSNLGTLESSIGFFWKCRSLETSNKSRSLTTSRSNLDTRDKDLRHNIWKQCRSLETSNKSRSFTTSRSNLDTRDENLRDNIWEQCRSLKTSNKSRSLTTSRSILGTQNEDLRHDIWKQCRSLKTSNKSRSFTTSRSKDDDKTAIELETWGIFHSESGTLGRLRRGMIGRWGIQKKFQWAIWWSRRSSRWKRGIFIEIGDSDVNRRIMGIVRTGSPDRKWMRTETWDWRASTWRVAGIAHERLGSTRDESRWCLEGNDGNRASDNRSTDETWPLDMVLRPLHELGRWGSEASGEAGTGVS